jgi:hypothetical protein
MSFCQQLKEKRGELQGKLRELYKIRDKIKEAKTLKELEEISERIKKEIVEIDKLISLFLKEIYNKKEIRFFLQVFSRLVKEDLVWCYDAYVQPDGILAGRLAFQKKDKQNKQGNQGVLRYVPFKGNILFKEIDGEKIINARDIHTQPDGTLAGVVKFQKKRQPRQHC